MEYACIAWPKLSAHLHNRLERFQRRAFKVIFRKPLFEPSDHDEVLLTLQQPSLESRRQYQSAILGFQLANKTAPQHLLNECFPAASPARTLRQRNHFQLPTPHTTLYQSSPIYFAAHTFNELPKHLQSINNLSEFKRRAQQHFLSYSCPCSNHPNRSAFFSFSFQLSYHPRYFNTHARTHTHTHTHAFNLSMHCFTPCIRLTPFFK